MAYRYNNLFNTIWAHSMRPQRSPLSRVVVVIVVVVVVVDIACRLRYSYSWRGVQLATPGDWQCNGGLQ